MIVLEVSAVVYFCFGEWSQSSNWNVGFKRIQMELILLPVAEATLLNRENLHWTMEKPDATSCSHLQRCPGIPYNRSHSKSHDDRDDPAYNNAN